MLVGSGVVGREIAKCHVDRGIGFHWLDTDATSLTQTANDLSSLGGEIEATKWIDDLHRIEMLADGSVRAGAPEFGDSPLVIESIVEQADAKSALFQSLHGAFGDACMLASNTSTLRIAELAKPSFAERLIGMHFFMPVTQRDGVEIIPHDGTNAQVRDAAWAHARRLAKRPFLAPDDAGFIVNRMLSPYLNECLWMACEGVSASTMAAAATRYGMPISPFRLIDTIGLATTLRAGTCYVRVFPDAIEPCPVITRMVKLGRISGDLPQMLEPDAEVFTTEAQAVFDRYRRDRRKMSVSEIVERMRLPMRCEAAALRRIHGVRDSTIDAAMSGGLAFRTVPGWTAEERAADTATQRQVAKDFGVRMPKV